MWFLVGAKTKKTPIAGGRQERRHCSACRQVTLQVETEIQDGFSLYLVEVGSVRSRRLVCTACGEDHELPAPARVQPRRSGDDLLAELKRKMNR